MRVDAPKVAVASAQVTITGRGLFTWPTKHERVQVTIPRSPPNAPPPPAALRHRATGGTLGSIFVCAFESPSFRDVLFEEAQERSVERFTSYDTGLLPSGGPARDLTIAAAYAEAGIEMVRTREPTVIDSSTAGPDGAWSDAELHAAMEKSFSRWAEIPQWAIWLMHAVTHEDPEIFGLMFDHQGLQRQGCAVFYQGLSPSQPKTGRELLHGCIHELGHGFNLLHCWQRLLDWPSEPSRPAARSWMNYPDRFPGGPSAYWTQFAFEFDDVEIVRLRHSFRETVIMGGDPFAGRSTSARAERWDAERQDLGLRLKLAAPKTQAEGVPVTVRLELATTSGGVEAVPLVLGPRSGTIELAVSDPSGDQFLFEPLLHHCFAGKLVPLRAGGPPVQSYAFIHYGRDGFVFERPGVYLLRARYAAPSGAVALSPTVPIRVTAATTRVGRAVVELVSGNDQVGKLMALMGSDAPGLRSGNETLQTIMDRYPGHPMADIARVVQATNLMRAFKAIEADGSVVARDPDVQTAASIAGHLVDVSQLVRPRPELHAVHQAKLPRRRSLDPSVAAFINSRLTDVRRPPLRGASPPRRPPRSPRQTSPTTQ